MLVREVESLTSEYIDETIHSLELCSTLSSKLQSCFRKLTVDKDCTTSFNKEIKELKQIIEEYPEHKIIILSAATNLMTYLDDELPSTRENIDIAQNELFQLLLDVISYERCKAQKLLQPIS